MCGPNPLLFRGKLGVGGSLLIVRHSAGCGVYGKSVSVSSFHTHFNMGIFLVPMTHVQESLNEFLDFSEGIDPGLAVYSVHPRRREFQESPTTPSWCHLSFIFSSILPPKTVDEKSRCSINICLIGVKEYYKNIQTRASMVKYQIGHLTK